MNDHSHVHHLAEEQPSAPISRLVAEVATQCPGERVTLGEMTEAFGDRAFGLLILLLCLPGLLPGMASVFGTPMLILGVQMGLGFRQPRLPAFIARQTRGTFAAYVRNFADRAVSLKFPNASFERLRPMPPADYARLQREQRERYAVPYTSLTAPPELTPPPPARPTPLPTPSPPMPPTPRVPKKKPPPATPFTP